MFDQVFDGDMPSQLTADLVLMLVDAETGAEPVEHLNDLRRPLLRQQIDLQIDTDDLLDILGRSVTRCLTHGLPADGERQTQSCGDRVRPNFPLVKRDINNSRLIVWTTH
jgi:hypothetical protein